jgi:hypothetical protein
MQFRKLETLKQRFNTPYWSPLFNILNEMQEKHDHTVVPAIISKKLKIPFGETVHLLGLLESEQVLKRGYQVYTNESTFPLGEFQTIPKKVYDANSNTYLDPDQFFVDLVFHIQSGTD